MTTEPTFMSEMCRIMSEVVKEGGFASSRKDLSPELFRFIDAVQRKAEKVMLPKG